MAMRNGNSTEAPEAPSKTISPYNFLAHAQWHCLFGSAENDRTPDAGDIEAAEILRKLRMELLLNGVK